MQKAVKGAKILLDLATESSDALPALKSVLGFFNGLVKHYGVGHSFVKLFLLQLTVS